MAHGRSTVVSGRTDEVAAAIVADAEAVADAADARGGIRTRPARSDELDGVLARFESTWGKGRGFDRATLHALDHAGNTVLVAVAAPRAEEPALPMVEERPAQPDASRNPAPAPGAPIGATLGFLGWSGGLHLHSHMNAVDPAARGRGIGVALKLRQRAVCLAHGVTEMRWTYDPLIRRNAHLNLVRLGAEVVAFHPDFYGRLDDAITGADHSDRFEVRWRLESPRTARALTRGPVPEWRAEGGLALVADYERVRVDAPEVAARLRAASRDAFAVLGDESAVRAELDANGDYVFTRDDPDREAE
jgi:predicted GNAT superfamily acetyltransferase